MNGRTRPMNGRTRPMNPRKRMSNAMRPTLLMLAALLLSATAGCSGAPPPKPAPVAAPDSVRPLQGGSVTGFVNEYGSHSWMGIAYAAPPVGERRWHAPLPAAPLQGNVNALSGGSPCIQFGSPLGGVGEPGTRQGNEDCLYLNIHAPRMGADKVAAAKLPVMVWIHGGGNTVGYAGFYSGAHLARAQRVIVVMINYRLGPFGWFVLPGKPIKNPPHRRDQPSPEDTAIDASGNWGTLDTIAALRWVKQNITAFGGNADNVTVFGESAGGTNIMALLLSPLAEGLFQRAIVQSGGVGFDSLARASNYTDPAEPGAEPGAQSSSREILLKLLVSQRRAATRAEARTMADAMSQGQIADFLRAINPWTLYAAYAGPGLLGPQVPTVFQDGAVIRTGDPLQLLSDPSTHIDVPTLLGTNRDEPKIFMAFNPEHVYRLAGLPMFTKDSERYDREARYGALSWKVRGVDEVAAALARNGAPAFAYRWDWDEQGTRMGFIDLSHLLGAAHGLEIPFVFGHFDIGPQSAFLFSDDSFAGRKALSDAMMSYWANFARTGEPGRGGDGKQALWSAWSTSSGGGKTMLLDSPDGGGLRMSAQEVTRASLLQEMAQEPISDDERCALFRTTFRWDDDGWAEAAWKTYNGGRCASMPRLPAGAR